MRFHYFLFLILLISFCAKCATNKSVFNLILKNREIQSYSKLELFSKDTILLKNISIQSIKQLDNTICTIEQNQKIIKCSATKTHIILHQIKNAKIGFNSQTTSSISGLSDVYLNLIALKNTHNKAIFSKINTQDNSHSNINVNNLINFDQKIFGKNLQVYFSSKHPIIWLTIISNAFLSATKQKHQQNVQNVFFYPKKKYKS